LKIGKRNLTTTWRQYELFNRTHSSSTDASCTRSW